MSTNVRVCDFLEKDLGPITFGTFLTAVRAMYDFSQSDLARKLKVRRSMICDIEKGRVLVSPTLAVRIARIGGFPESLAVQYCLQDQLRKARIDYKVTLLAA